MSLPPPNGRGICYYVQLILYNKEIPFVNSNSLFFYDNINKLALDVYFLNDISALKLGGNLLGFLCGGKHRVLVGVDGNGYAVLKLSVDLNGDFNLAVNTKAFVILRPIGKGAKSFKSALLPKLLGDVGAKGLSRFMMVL